MTLNLDWSLASKKKKKKKKRQLRVPCLIWGILSMDEKLYDIMEFLQNV